MTFKLAELHPPVPRFLSHEQSYIKTSSRSEHFMERKRGRQREREDERERESER